MVLNTPINYLPTPATVVFYARQSLYVTFIHIMYSVCACAVYIRAALVLFQLLYVYFFFFSHRPYRRGRNRGAVIILVQITPFANRRKKRKFVYRVRKYLPTYISQNILQDIHYIILVHVVGTPAPQYFIIINELTFVERKHC